MSCFVVCISFLQQSVDDYYFTGIIVMAHIFTIDFQFQEATHVAMVSSWKKEEACEIYQVVFNDEALQHVVPDGVIRFNNKEDGIVQANPILAELVCSLKKAINRYLQKFPNSQGHAV